MNILTDRRRLVSLSLATSLAAAAMLAGCRPDGYGLRAGVNVPTGDPTVRVDYTIEPELVPNAKLVREDTVPRWQLGRYGYAPGEDTLLVLVRRSYYPDVNDDDGEKKLRAVERAWITIPQDTPIGEVVYLEELEGRFLVGYDQREANDAYFIQPNRVLGVYTVTQRDENTITVNVDVEVRPKEMRNWRVNETITLPLAGKTTEASKANLARVIKPEETSIVSLFGPEDDTQAQTDDPFASPDAPASPDDQNTASPPGDQQPGDDPTQAQADADSGTITTRQGEIDKSDPRSLIIGRWHAATDLYDLRFQFEADGSYVFASTRWGGFTPGVKMGTYRVTSVEQGGKTVNFVILRIESFDYGGGSSLHFLDERVISLQIDRRGNNLRLFGDYGGREGQMDVMYEVGQFADMKRVRPPNGGQRPGS